MTSSEHKHGLCRPPLLRRTDPEATACVSFGAACVGFYSFKATNIRRIERESEKQKERELKEDSESACKKKNYVPPFDHMKAALMTGLEEHGMHLCVCV